MKKLRMVTVVGTRPEIIRLSRIIDKFDRYFDHTLIHTGQNYDYELSEIFFRQLGIRKPDAFLGANGKTGAETIGNVISATDKLISVSKPDAMLVLGDTNSCLAVISAKRNKVPTFHMEAGNRCFDMRVPEEINRKIVDHVSDINLPYSDIARDYLLREGLNPDLVIKTGSPMFEVLSYYKQDFENSEILNVLGLEKNKFFVVSIHREENVEDSENFEAIVGILNELGKRYDLQVIVSTHPRTRKKIKSRNIKFHKHVKLCKPFGFADYNKLQISAKAVLSDSGTITEESSILNFPALNLRETHERLEGMDEASVMMVGRNLERTFQALKILENQPRGLDRSLFLPSDYNVPNVSEKVVRIIMSYCDYSKRVVWKEH